MVDPEEALSKARKAVTDRAELPGMSLMEHLDELRRRIVHSALYLAAGFFVAWFFRDHILGFLQAPLTRIGKNLVFTHPMDALNLNLQASLLQAPSSPARSSSIRCGSLSRPAFIKRKSAS